VPGPGTVIFGGNTPCVEIRCSDRLVILDAGSGLVPLGRSLGAKTGDAFDLLLTHCHHDHVQGLMFFAPLLTKGCTARIHAGHLGGDSAEEVLTRMFSPPLFPVSFKDLPGRAEFRGFRAGDDILLPDGLRLATHPLQHPSGATAYRIDHADRRVCYVTDIEHDDGPPAPSLVEFVSGADLVIYDAMFSEDEFCRCRGWGHSTWKAGAALCRAADARRLAAFHHHPKYDDAQLAALETELAAVLPGSFFAREGQTVAFLPRPALAAAEMASLQDSGASGPC
jgi:phosphoribosyl 1,2-cyclic phosphodiesterase